MEAGAGQTRQMETICRPAAAASISIGATTVAPAGGGDGLGAIKKTGNGGSRPSRGGIEKGFGLRGIRSRERSPNVRGTSPDELCWCACRSFVACQVVAGELDLRLWPSRRR